MPFVLPEIPAVPCRLRKELTLTGPALGSLSPFIDLIQMSLAVSWASHLFVHLSCYSGGKVNSKRNTLQGRSILHHPKQGELL